MNNQEMVKLLEYLAKEERFCQYIIEEGDANEKGDGYLGVVNELRLVGRDLENKDKVLNLIVKVASSNSALRNEAPLEIVYDREIYMYKVVFPTFTKFEIEKGLKPSAFFPKFYKGQTVHKNEILILENLKHSGYKSYQRKTPMTEDHVCLVIKAYARLHALSFALRDQNIEKFNTAIGSMNDVFIKFMKEAKFEETVINLSIKAQAALDINLHEESFKIYRSFVNTIQSFFDELPKCVDNYSVALHGDCWTSNMLFKYEDSHDVRKPTKVCFVDFQLSRLGPPVLDLAYFFYSCSSKEIINRLDYHLELYYSSLSSYLLELGTDPQKAFPYSIFQQQWTRYARYGLFMAAAAIHIMLSEKDEAVDLADVAESGAHVKDAFNYQISNTEVYNERMRHIILHFIEHKLI